MRDFIKMIEDEKANGGINRYIGQQTEEYLARRGFANYDAQAVQDEIKKEINLLIIDGLLFGPKRKRRGNNRPTDPIK